MQKKTKHVIHKTESTIWWNLTTWTWNDALVRKFSYNDWSSIVRGNPL